MEEAGQCEEHCVQIVVKEGESNEKKTYDNCYEHLSVCDDDARNGIGTDIF